MNANDGNLEVNDIMDEDKGVGGHGVTDAAEVPSGDRGGEERPAAEGPGVVLR